jgi:hypothetical protein
MASLGDAPVAAWAIGSTPDMSAPTSSTTAHGARRRTTGDRR